MNTDKIYDISPFFDKGINIFEIHLPFGYEILIRRRIKTNYKWQDQESFEILNCELTKKNTIRKKHINKYKRQA